MPPEEWKKPVWMVKELQDMNLLELDTTARDERVKEPLRKAAAALAVNVRRTEKRKLAALKTAGTVISNRSSPVGHQDMRSVGYAAKRAHRKSARRGLPSLAGVWTVFLTLQSQGVLPPLGEWMPAVSGSVWVAVGLLVGVTVVAVWVMIFALEILEERRTEWIRR